MKSARQHRAARSKTASVAAGTRAARATVHKPLIGKELVAGAPNLAAMTFGQLRLLVGAATPLMARIRPTEGGYRIEVDLGPRRWVLVSTHGKRPRLFRHLDGAASALRALGAPEVIVELGHSESAASPASSKSNRSR